MFFYEGSFSPSSSIDATAITSMTAISDLLQMSFASDPQTSAVAASLLTQPGSTRGAQAEAVQHNQGTIRNTLESPPELIKPL